MRKNICYFQRTFLPALKGNNSRKTYIFLINERGKDREVFATSETYSWSFVTQIFLNGQPSRGGDRKTFEVMTST
jgi:hypothetical protein